MDFVTPNRAQYLGLIETANPGLAAASVSESDTLTIIGDTVIADETWYLFESTRGELFSGFFLRGLMTIRGDGLWFRCPPDQPYEWEYRFAKYPAESGDSYELNYTWTPPDYIEYVAVEETGMSITTPYGVVMTDCHRYSFLDDANPWLFTRRYWAPGIGLAGVEGYVDPGKGISANSHPQLWSVVKLRSAQIGR